MSEQDEPADFVELSAILVNYNTRRMTLDCLEKLLRELDPAHSEVLVVDNASTDGSADAIREAFPRVELIQSQRNLGFGGGNNLAMRQSKGKYLLLINTDAFVRPGAIAALLAYLKSHAEAALVGPRLLFADGSLQRSCYRFPSPIRAWAETLWISGLFGGDHLWGDYRRWSHDRAQAVDWVIGACCLVRREAYEQTGGFDERFFMYAEETDWQKRMRDKGWEIGFAPSAEVVHLGGASGATRATDINPHFFRSQDLYSLKHHGRIGLILMRAAAITGCLLRMPCWLLLRLIRPRNRALAMDKFSFASRLLVRQLTNWSLLKNPWGA